MWGLISFLLIVTQFAEASSKPPAENAAALRTEFEARYAAWVEATKANTWSSAPSINEAYVELLCLGHSIAPLVIEKAEQEGSSGDNSCVLILRVILKKDFPDDVVRRSDQTTADSRSATKAEYIRWWHAGHPLDKGLFDEYCMKLKKFEIEGDEEQVRAYSRKLRGLGVGVMPLLVERIVQGDDYLISELSTLSRGYYVEGLTPVKNADKLLKHALPEDATPKEVAAWWTENKAWFTLPVE